MKRIFSIAICAIMMAVCTTAVQAQDNQSKKQRMSREQLSEAQARHIAHDLALDDATTQKFVKTFCDYQKEVWAMGPKVKAPKKKAEMTDAETDQVIKARMERSKKILDLREKYYKEYSKFLTPRQIQRVYELEKKSMKRLQKRAHIRHQKKGHQSKHRRQS